MAWSIIPRDRTFFSLFANQARKVVEAARLLCDLVEHFEDPEAKAKALKQLEHDADVIAHEVLDRLNRSFITPIERDDISALVKNLDDVIDHIEGAAARFVLWDLRTSAPPAVEMARVIAKAAEEIEKAVASLEGRTSLHVFLVEINRLENVVDTLSRQAIGRLFREEKDLRELIKWKEVYEKLEACADSCEDVADVIEDIVIKNA